MTDLLFNVPEVLSPRLAWMREYHISTHHLESGKVAPWSAWTHDFGDAVNLGTVGYGNTEDDALVDLAKKLKIKLWNES